MAVEKEAGGKWETIEWPKAEVFDLRFDTIRNHVARQFQESLWNLRISLESSNHVVLFEPPKSYLNLWNLILSLGIIFRIFRNLQIKLEIAIRCVGPLGKSLLKLVKIE